MRATDEEIAESLRKIGQSRTKLLYRVGSDRLLRIAKTFGAKRENPNTERGKRLADADREGIQQMLRDGATHAQIAKRYGVSMSTVAGYKRKMECGTVPPPVYAEPKVSKPCRFEASELVLEGDSTRALLFEGKRCRVLFNSPDARRQFVADLQGQLEGAK